MHIWCKCCVSVYCCICATIFARVHKNFNESTIAFFTSSIISIRTSYTNTYSWCTYTAPLNQYSSHWFIHSFRMSMIRNWKFISICNSKWSVLNFLTHSCVCVWVCNFREKLKWNKFDYQRIEFVFLIYMYK